jgi:hypothetical protein
MLQRLNIISNQYPALLTLHSSHLGGVMVIMLAIRPKVHMFKPSQSNGFLRAIEICSMPSFGGELKPEPLRCKILWHVKNHIEI